MEMTYSDQEDIQGSLGQQDLYVHGACAKLFAVNTKSPCSFLVAQYFIIAFTNTVSDVMSSSH